MSDQQQEEEPYIVEGIEFAQTASLEEMDEFLQEIPQVVFHPSFRFQVFGEEGYGSDYAMHMASAMATCITVGISNFNRTGEVDVTDVESLMRVAKDIHAVVAHMVAVGVEDGSLILDHQDD